MAKLLTIEEARERLFALSKPVETISCLLSQCVGRTLAADVIAMRNQPAKNLSAMDGYATRSADFPGPWQLVGESAAGVPFEGTVQAGETVRIFTGAALPDGADSVLVQEDIEADGLKISLSGDGPDSPSKHIRNAGSDFSKNDVLLAASECVSARSVALAAMGGHGALSVYRNIKIAIISNGNELRAPGEPVTDHQIPNSNGIMLSSLLRDLPVEVTDYGIIEDQLEALEETLKTAKQNHDVIVTIGGASVGDHDLVKPALETSGAKLDFWRIAMKPGKPLLAAQLDSRVVIGLPGNPVSAFVTATLFLLPFVRYLSGLKDYIPQTRTAQLDHDLPSVGPRTEFLRAITKDGAISTHLGQDSAMLSALNSANSLLIRESGSPGAEAGTKVDYIAI